MLVNTANPSDALLKSDAELFCRTIDIFADSPEGKPFRLTTSLNVAVFDTCMVGLAKRLKSKKSLPDSARVQKAYKALLDDKDYMEAVSRSTADPIFVNRRMKKATEALSEC